MGLGWRGHRRRGGIFLLVKGCRDGRGSMVWLLATTTSHVHECFRVLSKSSPNHPLPDPNLQIQCGLPFPSPNLKPVYYELLTAALPSPLCCDVPHRAATCCAVQEEVEVKEAEKFDRQFNGSSKQAAHEARVVGPVPARLSCGTCGHVPPPGIGGACGSGSSGAGCSWGSSARWTWRHGLAGWVGWGPE